MNLAFVAFMQVEDPDIEVYFHQNKNEGLELASEYLKYNPLRPGRDGSCIQYCWTGIIISQHQMKFHNEDLTSFLYQYGESIPDGLCFCSIRGYIHHANTLVASKPTSMCTYDT
jgi:hypothetical protein